MEVKKYKSLLRKYSHDPHHLIRLHCMGKINLDMKQIKEVIKIRDETDLGRRYERIIKV